MEDTNTTWKNHSFTLLIFGGIVALCLIFFVLGMLVGRNQGKRIAETAFAEEAEKKTVADKAAEEFPLEFYSQTTEEKPELKLQPAAEPASVASSSSTAPSHSTTTASADLPVTKPAEKPEAKPEPAKSSTVKSTATAKPAVSRTPSKSPAAKEVFLQAVSYTHLTLPTILRV